MSRFFYYHNFYQAIILKLASRSKSQISEAQRTEICRTNYPIPINNLKVTVVGIGNYPS